MDVVSDTKLTDCDDKAVTPEMIEAGVGILMQFEWGWSDPKTYAADIYRAMASAWRRDDESTSAPFR